MRNFYTNIHLLLFSLLLTLGACNSKETAHKIISVDDTIKKLSINDITEEIIEIPLEFSEQTMIGPIGKVEFSNDLIFVHDITNSRVLNFDLKGNFIQQIGVQGEGPGEYTYMKSFTIDESSETVYIGAQGKIIKHNFDGEFIEEKRGFNMINYMAVINDELKIFTTQFGYQNENSNELFNLEILQSFDRELRKTDSVLLKKIPIKKSVGSTFPMAKYLSKSKREYYLYIPVLIPEYVIRDTIYKFSENELSFHTKIDFQPFQNPEKDRKSVNIKSIIKTDNYFITEFLNKGNKQFIYDIKNQEGYYMEEGINVAELIMEETTSLFPILNRENEVYFTGKPQSQADADYEPNASIFVVKLK